MEDLSVREIRDLFKESIERNKKLRYVYSIKMKDPRLSYEQQLEAAYMYKIYNTLVRSSIPGLHQLNSIVNKTDRVIAEMITSIAMIEDEINVQNRRI